MKLLSLKKGRHFTCKCKTGERGELMEFSLQVARLYNQLQEVKVVRLSVGRQQGASTWWVLPLDICWNRHLVAVRNLRDKQKDSSPRSCTPELTKLCGGNNHFFRKCSCYTLHTRPGDTM